MLRIGSTCAVLRTRSTLAMAANGLTQTALRATRLDMRRTERLAVRLEPDQRIALEAIARVRGVSVSSVLRATIDAALQRWRLEQPLVPDDDRPVTDDELLAACYGRR